MNPFQHSEDRLSPPTGVGAGDGGSSEEEDGAHIYDEPPDGGENKNLDDDGKGYDLYNYGYLLFICRRISTVCKRFGEWKRKEGYGAVHM